MVNLFSLRSAPLRLYSWIKAIRRVRRVYARAHGRPLNIMKPRRFTEKLQWRKLFDLNPRFAVLCNRLAARDYITALVGDAHLVPLLWSGAPDDIPWDELKPPYVLKSTHASGQILMIDVDTLVDREAVRDVAAHWLKEAHGSRKGELGYGEVPRRLMIERTVTADGHRPTEARFFMFDGRVEAINTVFIEAGRIRNGAFHRADWTPLDWHFSRIVERKFPPPQRLTDMIEVAQRVAAGLDHVRVDFYDCGEQFWIGELTLYSWSGLSRIAPDQADFVLGAAWRLERPIRRAVSNVLLRERRISPPSSR